MSKISFDDEVIDLLSAPHSSGKQKLYWDNNLTGFGLLLSGKTSAKSYVVQRDVNGKSRRITIGPTNVFKLVDAREKAKLILADLYKGVDPKAKHKAEKANALTLREALNAYLATNKNLRPKSAHEYRMSLERYLSDWLNKPIREITRDMVEERHRQIQEQVGQRSRTRLANGNSSANGTMRVLRLLWNHALARYPDLGENPVRSLSQLKAWYPEVRRERLVKASELPAFYNAVTDPEVVPNPIHRDYLLTVLFTGLRRYEAASLRWDDVDLVERVICLPAIRTKAGRRLDLPMSDYLHGLFTARRAIGLDGPYVFSADSKSGHIVEPRFALDAVAKATGIKVTMHDLRRTFITVAEACDIPVYALKGLVNHSMGTDVTAGYVIAGSERLRQPMQKVTDKFKELIGWVDPEPETIVKRSKRKLPIRRVMLRR